MAPSSLEIGDRRLAYATAMCLADGARIELPLAREDHFRAWSAVGGAGRLVRVKYPWRPIYGINPLFALIGGLIATFVGLRARRFFSDVARGDAWESLYERFEQQDWLISDIATGIVFLSFVLDPARAVGGVRRRRRHVQHRRTHRCDHPGAPTGRGDAASRARWSSESKVTGTASTSRSTTARPTRSRRGGPPSAPRPRRASTPSFVRHRSSATSAGRRRSATSSRTRRDRHSGSSRFRGQ